MRIGAMLIALVVSAPCFAAKSPALAPQGPQVEAQQQAERTPKNQTAAAGDSNARVSEPIALAHKDDSAGHGEKGEKEGTEFYTAFGYKFKITDGLLVLLSCVLAWFTGLLWISTKRLWQETKAIRELSEKELREANRPRLVMTDCTGSVEEITYTILNTGGSPALITEISARLWPPQQRLHAQYPPVPLFEDVGEPVNIKIGVGQMRWIDYRTTDQTMVKEYQGSLGHYQVRRYHKPTDVLAPRLWFIGYIAYTYDGQTRHTWFCRKHDDDNSRFNPDARYERQD